MAHAQRNRELAERYEKGESVASLAESYGLKQGSVRNVMSALGASRKQSIASARKSIVQAVHSGAKPSDVAVQFDVSVNWARKLARDDRDKLQK